MSATALLMTECSIGMVDSWYSVLVCCKSVGHLGALPFHPGVECRILLPCLGSHGTRRQRLSVAPPGRPAERRKKENAPGVLGCIAEGVMFHDEGART